MDFWNKARSFAEEAAKRTQDLTKEAAKRSQDLSFGNSRFSDIVAETTKRSKDIAAEASKRADQIRIEAIKRADQIKHLAEGITPPGSGVSRATAPDKPHLDSVTQEKDLERFGITEELREFVKGITPSTFRDFPLEDDTQQYDVLTVSNVRQDLTEWQEKHANLVLSTVKEISKLRYELCPRVMKERKFWRIYFILMSSHIAPYEKRYMEDAELKSSEQVKDNKAGEPPEVGLTSNQLEQEIEMENRTSSSEQETSNQQEKEVKRENRTSSAEQDLDEFLLGDTGDSDDDPDDGNGAFDDDLDNMVECSDDEKGKS